MYPTCPRRRPSMAWPWISRPTRLHPPRTMTAVDRPSTLVTPTSGPEAGVRRRGHLYVDGRFVCSARPRGSIGRGAAAGSAGRLVRFATRSLLLNAARRRRGPRIRLCLHRGAQSDAAGGRDGDAGAGQAKAAASRVSARRDAHEHHTRSGDRFRTRDGSSSATTRPSRRSTRLDVAFGLIILILAFVVGTGRDQAPGAQRSQEGRAGVTRDHRSGRRP